MKAVLVKYKQVSEGTEPLQAMKQDCDKSYFQALKVLGNTYKAVIRAVSLVHLEVHPFPNNKL